MSRSQGSFQIFVTPFPWHRACLTDLLHIWHKYIKRRRCIAFYHFKVTLVIRFFLFLSCLLRGSVPAWSISFICEINSIYEGAMCLVPFLGQKVKGQDHIVVWNFGRICSVAQRLFDRIAFLAQKNTIRWKCVVHHFQVKGQGHANYSKSMTFLLCGSMPFWSTHFILGKTQAVRGRCVAHHLRVKRPKVKVTQVVQSFVGSTPWLRGYSIDWLRMRHRYNPWEVDCPAPFPGQKSKFNVTHTGRSSLLPYPLCGSIYISLIRFTYGTNTIHRVLV